MENNKQGIISTKDFFSQDNVKAKFQELLGKRATGFITSVLQVIASNALLKNADPNSVYNSAAAAATLDLPINNNLGFAYIVPYNERYRDADGNWQSKSVAQFQMGYKGFKQLALRSGQFKGINVTDVREGELKSRDRKTGEMVFDWVQDEEAREKLNVVGYLNHFELLNGFSQSFYMTVAELERHAKKYSQTYQKDKGKWKDDFKAMAEKTVTKLNLSKNAPLSIEMQKAITFDQAVINDTDTEDVTYVDNDKSEPEPITENDLQILLDEKVSLLNKSEFDNAKRIIENKEVDSYPKLLALLNEKKDV